MMHNKSNTRNINKTKGLCEAKCFYPEFFKAVIVEPKKKEECATEMLAKYAKISSKQNPKARFQEFTTILSSFDVVLLH